VRAWRVGRLLSARTYDLYVISLLA